MKNRFYLLALLALCAVMLFSCVEPSANAGGEMIDKTYGAFRVIETEGYSSVDFKGSDMDLDDDYSEYSSPNEYLNSFDFLLRGECTDIRCFTVKHEIERPAGFPEDKEFFVLYTFKISDEYIVREGESFPDGTIKVFCDYMGTNNARYHVSMEVGKEYIIAPYSDKDRIESMPGRLISGEDRLAFYRDVFGTYYHLEMTSHIMPVIDGDVHLLGGIVADYEALGDEPEERWIENKIGGYPIRRLAVNADKFAAYYTKFYNESPEEYKQNPWIHYEYRDPEGKWAYK